MPSITNLQKITIWVFSNPKCHQRKKFFNIDHFLSYKYIHSQVVKKRRRKLSRPTPERPLRDPWETPEIPLRDPWETPEGLPCCSQDFHPWMQGFQKAVEGVAVRNVLLLLWRCYLYSEWRGWSWACVGGVREAACAALLRVPAEGAAGGCCGGPGHKDRIH